ncbi:MAG TPA: ASCH domain-containing protein [Candidatus Paceibacterota bacterium]|nr:ASCH domain-containing protein [Candidatus Paceibacterota bacterium]
MKLQSEPFIKIKNGSKSIEIRLNDEKRQLLKVGDDIEFSLLSDPTQTVKTKVLELLKYKTFKDLFNAFPFEVFGSETKEDLNGIYQYYSTEEESRWGVLGIRVERYNI